MDLGPIEFVTIARRTKANGSGEGLPLAIAPIPNAYGTIEIVGVVLIVPLTVQPPARATFVNLMTPFVSFVGRLPGPQLPIGEVKDTL